MDINKVLELSQVERGRMLELQEALIARQGKERAKILGQLAVMVTQLRGLVPPPELFASPALYEHQREEVAELMSRVVSVTLDRLGDMDKATLSKADWDKKQEDYGNEIVLLVEATEKALIGVATATGVALADVLQNLKNGGDGKIPPTGDGPTLH